MLLLIGLLSSFHFWAEDFASRPLPVHKRVMVEQMDGRESNTSTWSLRTSSPLWDDPFFYGLNVCFEKNIEIQHFITIHISEFITSI